VRIEFPYENVPALDVPDGNLSGVYGPEEIEERAPIREQVAAALRAPIGGPALRVLAENTRDILVVVDDISRPTPVRAIVPPLIDELHAAGVDDGRIAFLIALGTHRPMTRKEIVARLGREVVERHVVDNHDWQHPDACVPMGETSEGVPVHINRKVAEADLIIGVGRIMPIDICGFTGGGKILIPGACGQVTNDEMHWTRVDLPDGDVTGRRDNAVRASIDEMARRAGLGFIVNVVMDGRQRVCHVVAGDMVEAHRRGCELALKVHAVSIPDQADIVVADSFPFDIEFWQANKALGHAGMVVRRGGVIILVSPCCEGFSAVHRDMLEYGYPPVEEIKRLVTEGRIKHKVVGVHMAQVSRVAREKAHLVLVTDGIPERDVSRVGFEYAATPTEALARAFEMAGPDARIAVLRNAAEMLPIVGVAR